MRVQLIISWRLVIFIEWVKVYFGERGVYCSFARFLGFQVQVNIVFFDVIYSGFQDVFSCYLNWFQSCACFGLLMIDVRGCDLVVIGQVEINDSFDDSDSFDSSSSGNGSEEK